MGRETLKLLKERSFPIASLKLLASRRSAGQSVSFLGEKLTVQELTRESFEGVDLVFSSASSAVSRAYIPSAVEAGALVIDNTSCFRLRKDVPLVIPEINRHEIRKNRGIIANPNCSTIIMLLPLWPLHRQNPIERVVVSTYQAASGAGALAMKELKKETTARLKGEDFSPTVIPHPYAFNVFPHNSPMEENGYCQEENKMIAESRKILGVPNLRISPTCVRVPVLRAHSEAVNVEFHRSTSVEELYILLEKAQGVKILENRKENRWPMPTDANGKDEVLVGRIREDPSGKNAFDLWIVGDQIRKGAALNAIQIAEESLSL